MAPQVRRSRAGSARRRIRGPSCSCVHHGNTDLIFLDTATGRWVLVEVKATARKRLGTKVTTDMTKLLRHLSSVYMLRNGKYTAVIVTVQVKDESS